MINVRTLEGSDVSASLVWGDSDVSHVTLRVGDTIVTLQPDDAATLGAMLRCASDVVAKAQD